MADPPKNLTEDMVRTLLKMNPHLRGDGQSTKDVLSVIQTGVKKPAAAPVTTKANELDLAAEVDKLRARFDAAMGELQAEENELKAALQQTAAERQKARRTVCDTVVQALLRLDRNLAKPEHQALLKKEQAFFSDIGFSIERLIAAGRKHTP